MRFYLNQSLLSDIAGGTVNHDLFCKANTKECTEHKANLYRVFVDLLNTFHNVNRNTLQKILKSLDALKSLSLFLLGFHKTRVNVCSKLTDTIQVENKEVIITRCTLLCLFLLFKDAHMGSTSNIKQFIRYRRFNAKTSPLSSIIRNFLYVDDCDLLAYSQSGMQYLLDSCSTPCSELCLTINPRNTEVMYQPVPGKSSTQRQVYVCMAINCKL